MKVCTQCNREKEYSQFSKDKQKKDGYCSHCKDCRRNYENKYYTANREKVRVRNRTYADLHKEQKQRYDKNRREQFRNTINQKKREYYYTTGKLVGYKWLINNPDKRLIYAKNRTAKRKEQLVSNLSSKELKQWQDQQSKICSYCNTDCRNDFQIDHIEALAIGGTHTLDNLTISCPTCNQSKGKKSLILWLAFKLSN